MTVDERWGGLLEDALHALLSMSPDEIEAVERQLGDPTLLQRHGVEPAIVAKLRLARAAALRSAQLWRGCIPLDGYGAMGPVEHVSGGSALSVTG